VVGRWTFAPLVHDDLPMGRLQDKVAIVTGGAGGIGSATARKLGQEGAAVVVTDINGEAAAAVAADITAAGGQAMSVQTDLANESDVVAMVASAVAAFGRLDILHNNAALTESDFLSRDTAVTELSLEVWDRTISVNLSSQMLTCKHVIPEMVKDGGGSIINMSSGAAFSGDRVRTAYGVSKAGVHTLTMYVATSHGKKNIRVNTIVPGLIITEAVRAHIPANALSSLSKATLTPHLGEPDDIADLVVFLSSEESKYITGQMIAIDGGMSVHAGHVGQEDD
jgi:NAD(P)-dependent dehydrogenase (short-subunit alcohol dehydrogenase family)